jgi:hypothetical protein
VSVTATSFGAACQPAIRCYGKLTTVLGPGESCVASRGRTDEKGCRVSTVSTLRKIASPARSRRKIGSEERKERPYLSFRRVVPKDGRICHALELSVWDP